MTEHNRFTDGQSAVGDSDDDIRRVFRETRPVGPSVDLNLLMSNNALPPRRIASFGWRLAAFATSVVTVVVLVGFLWIPATHGFDFVDMPARLKQVETEYSSHSIFNGKLCQFKFRLEYTEVVNMEEARNFMLRYRKAGKPKIIGAYPDPKSNLLVVIGPPEAEDPIRRFLAETIIQHQLGTTSGDDNLRIRKRTLQSQGRTLIREIAGVEIAKASRMNPLERDEPAESATRRKKQLEILNATITAFEQELSVIEEQIKVVDKYLERLDSTMYETSDEE